MHRRCGDQKFNLKLSETLPVDDKSETCAFNRHSRVVPLLKSKMILHILFVLSRTAWLGAWLAWRAALSTRALFPLLDELVWFACTCNLQFTFYLWTCVFLYRWHLHRSYRSTHLVFLALTLDIQAESIFFTLYRPQIQNLKIYQVWIIKIM